MPEIAPANTAEVLAALHDRLGAHFASLSQQRNALDQAAPVFALEHDLPSEEVEFLQAAVRAAIQEGLSDRHRKSWLPFVVYATESGYDYVGDEYWRSFENLTPGWRQDQRHWIKLWFQRFAVEYGGAVPVGAFAAHFTIIAWPITHSVMPTYLQRQMAQLLFEFRSALTTHLLDDPAELGRRLYVRAGNYSERFRIFCENTTLVGQVASALLSGDDEVTPYLTSPTLKRIVDGLSEEQQARQWLQSARRSAVQARGFKPTRPTGPGSKGPRQRSISNEPRVFLRFEESWAAHVELPNLSHLEHLHQGLRDDLRAKRCWVDGGARHVPPSGLLYSGQQVRLAEWPSEEGPFLYLDGADDEVNRQLEDCCVMSIGPWLFRVVEEGLATEIKGKAVRPGREYILVTTDYTPELQAPWSDETSLAVDGARAHALHVPDQLAASDFQALEAAGLSATAHVNVRPVGLVPKSWDGEGDVEWLAGEPGLLAISTDLEADNCQVTVDGALYTLEWVAGEPDLIFAIDGLEVGDHDVAITLRGPNDRHLAAGSLSIRIADPQVRREEATAGEGIRLLASPARPTMSELWDGRATMSIDGPTGVAATLAVSLHSATREQLTRTDRQIRLPLDSGEWGDLVREIRKSLADSYDEAEACVVAVSRDGVGFASLNCDRGYRPLRWSFTKRRNEPRQAQLIDRTDGESTTIELFAVKDPTQGHQLDHREPFSIPATGGLAVARAADMTLSTILPTDPNAMLHHARDASQAPGVPEPTRRPASYQQLIEIDALWASADMPGDPFASYYQGLVRSAIARTIAASIGGTHWAHVERRFERANDPADLLDDLQRAVGESPWHQRLASEVGLNLFRWLEPGALQPGFDAAIRQYVPKSGMTPQIASRFLLTLASEPGQLDDWDRATVSGLLDQLLRTPVFLRLARFAVLGVSALGDESTAN